MRFSYQEAFKSKSPQAYSNFAGRCDVGRRNAFHARHSSGGILVSLNANSETWEKSRPARFPNYQSGTWGPKAAETLNCERWSKLAGARLLRKFKLEIYQKIQQNSSPLHKENLDFDITRAAQISKSKYPCFTRKNLSGNLEIYARSSSRLSQRDYVKPSRKTSRSAE